jgi:hypothetical protein
MCDKRKAEIFAFLIHRARDSSALRAHRDLDVCLAMTSLDEALVFICLPVFLVLIFLYFIYCTKFIGALVKFARTPSRSRLSRFGESISVARF